MTPTPRKHADPAGVRGKGGRKHLATGTSDQASVLDSCVRGIRPHGPSALARCEFACNRNHLGHKESVSVTVGESGWGVWNVGGLADGESRRVQSQERRGRAAAWLPRQGSGVLPLMTAGSRGSSTKDASGEHDALR
jgi:hypothetical protein